ncbi:MAG: winged helix-turn-helix domain-containing protein [Acidimicrobiales bacterium]
MRDLLAALRDWRLPTSFAVSSSSASMRMGVLLFATSWPPGGWCSGLLRIGSTLLHELRRGDNASRLRPGELTRAVAGKECSAPAALSTACQNGHTLVPTDLLIAAIEGPHLSISELAGKAGVTLQTASKAISQLAEHGVAAKERDGHRVWVSVVDPTELASKATRRTDGVARPWNAGGLIGTTASSSSVTVSPLG